MSESKIFQDVVKLAPAERETFLAKACGSDLNLRQDVESLLRAHEATQGPLQDDPEREETIDTSGLQEMVGANVGPYKLMELIGEGGFGLVFVAEQQEPVQRKVALKVIKPGMDSRDVVARFEAERQALALMDHPNIARVFDGGLTETGRPYFVMELVKGLSITEYCDQAELSASERLQLFVDVCKAVQHAHAKGVIHRDLKPSNVLVAPYDGVPVVKVIDFGVAKAIGQRLSDKTIYTRFHQMIGTPLYMSPEQAEVNALDVDTRSDVYSLGVLLYELLTGTTPFDRQRFATAAIDEIRRVIREDDPPKPSTRLSTMGETLAGISARRKCDPTKLQSLVKGELDWIVMKALEKERTRRYETVDGLARDVQRYLADENVEACPPTMSYRLQKVYRKNKAAILTASTFGIVLLIATIVSATLSIQTRTALEGERDATEQARRAVKEKQLEAERAIASEQKAKQRLGELNAANDKLAREQYARTLQVAYSGLRNSKTTKSARLLMKVPEELRGWEWRFLMRMNVPFDFQISGEWDHKYYGTFSSDGQRLLVTGRDGTTRIWNANQRTKQPLREFSSRKGRSFFAALSHDGKQVITGASDSDDTAKRNGAIIWDAMTGEQRMWLSAPDSIIRRAMYRPDDVELATGDGNGNVSIRNVQTGAIRLSIRTQQEEIKELEYSSDGTRILSVGKDSTGSHRSLAKIWNADTGELLRSFEAMTATLSPDGQFIATANIWWPSNVDVVPMPYTSRVSIWDADSGRFVRAMGGNTNELVESLTFRPDGKALLASAYGTMHEWDVESGLMMRRINAHTPTVHWVRYSPDGAKIVSSSWSGVRIWPASTNHLPELRTRYRGAIHRSSFSPDGKLAVTQSGDDESSQICVWNVQTGESIRTFQPQFAHGYRQAAFSPDGSKVLAIAKNLRSSPHRAVGIEVWNARTGDRILTIDESAAATFAVFSPDGKSIATACLDGRAKIWDAKSGTLLNSFPGLSKALTCVGFHPDGTQIVAAGLDGTAKVWDIETGSEVQGFMGHEDSITYVEFNHDGSQVVTSSMDRTARLWDASTGKELHAIEGHFPGVMSASFSADGKRVATGGGDVSPKIWDVESGLEVLSLFVPSGDYVAFSPHGSFLVTSGEGGMITWDARPRQRISK